MPHRHIPGPPRLGGKTQPHQLGPHRVRVRGFGVKGKTPGGLQFRHHCRQLLLALHRNIIDRRGGRWRRAFRGGVRVSTGNGNSNPFLHRVGQAGDDAVKLQFRKQAHHLLAVKPAAARRRQSQLHRRLQANRSQIPIGKGQFPVFRQRLPHARRFHFRQMFINALQTLIFRQQADRPLFPNPGHPGNVVGTVPRQRLEIRLLRGGQPAVALCQFRLVINLAILGGVEQIHPHLRRNQLKGIPVAGQNHRVHPLRRRLPAQSPDNIIRLKPVNGIHRHPKSHHQLPGPPELRPQFRRRRLPLRLVVGKLLMPESGRRRVKGNGAMGRPPVLQGPQKDIGKPIHPGYILPGAGNRHALPQGYGPERAMHHSMAIHQQQQRLFRRGLFRRKQGQGGLLNRNHNSASANRLSRWVACKPAFPASCRQIDFPGQLPANRLSRPVAGKPAFPADCPALYTSLSLP